MTDARVEVIKAWPKVESLLDIPTDEFFFRIGCVGCKHSVEFKMSGGKKEDVDEVLFLSGLSREALWNANQSVDTGDIGCQGGICKAEQAINLTKEALKEKAGIDLG